MEHGISGTALVGTALSKNIKMALCNSKMPHAPLLPPLPPLPHHPMHFRTHRCNNCGNCLWCRSTLKTYSGHHRKSIGLERGWIPNLYILRHWDRDRRWCEPTAEARWKLKLKQLLAHPHDMYREIIQYVRTVTNVDKIFFISSLLVRRHHLFLI